MAEFGSQRRTITRIGGGITILLGAWPALTYDPAMSLFYTTTLHAARKL